MADRLIEDFKALKAFQDLIQETLKALGEVTTPTGLVRAIEPLMERWQKADAEFAGILKDLKGAAYNMTPVHLKTVVFQVVEHLKVNLERIRKQAAKL